jgi:hypothetical protein
MAAQWTYRQAWFCLIGSTLCTLVVSIGSYGLWNRWRQHRLHDERYLIRAIIQTGPVPEALKTSYLAEILGVSCDRPQNLYAFDLDQKARDLCASSLISYAKIKRMSPDTLYVDYTMRTPVAKIADYENIGIDREGYLFPLIPFFSPRQLPEIYLGLPPFEAEEDAQGRRGGRFNVALQNKHVRLAFEVLQTLQDASWKEGLRVMRIDVSNAFSTNYGQREIVLFTEEEVVLTDTKREITCFFPKILRLSSKEYIQQLSNFLSLQKNMLDDYRRQMAKECCKESEIHFQQRIIDLRIPQLAFVQNSPL